VSWERKLKYAQVPHSEDRSWKYNISCSGGGVAYVENSHYESHLFSIVSERKCPHVRSELPVEKLNNCISKVIFLSDGG
jgi:hypothetical protein